MEPQKDIGMSKSLLTIASLLLGAVTALGGCSSKATTGSDGGTDAGGSTSVSCGTPNCSQDPAISAADKQSCEASFSGSCGGLYGNATECLAAKIKCGADNKTDVASALAATAACQSQLSAFEACENGDGGAGDSGN